VNNPPGATAYRLNALFIRTSRARRGVA